MQFIWHAHIRSLLLVRISLFSTHSNLISFLCLYIFWTHSSAKWVPAAATADNRNLSLAFHAFFIWKTIKIKSEEGMRSKKFLLRFKKVHKSKKNMCAKENQNLFSCFLLFHIMPCTSFLKLRDDVKDGLSLFYFILFLACCWKILILLILN